MQFKGEPMIAFRNHALAMLLFCVQVAVASGAARADDPSPKLAEPTPPDPAIREKWKKAGAYSDGWLVEGHREGYEPIPPDAPFGFQFQVFQPDKLVSLPDLDQPFVICFKSTAGGRGAPPCGSPRLHFCDLVDVLPVSPRQTAFL
jgi:hypothetical protein